MHEGDTLLYQTSICYWWSYIIDVYYLLKFFEYYTKILGITSCKPVTIKIIISNMSVPTNWQNIQCIIILVIVNISLNQTHAVGD